MPEVYVAPKVEEGRKKYSPTEMINGVLARVGETRSKSLLRSYCVAPGKRFINEQADEEVVLLLRSHPITNLKWIVIAMGMLILPELLTILGAFSTAPMEFVTLGKLAWYLMTLAYVMEEFLDWYYTVFIVTNERVWISIFTTC